MVTPIPAHDGRPDPFAEAGVWPELWRDLPALVFPARPDHPTDTGWLPGDAAALLDQAPRWLASLQGGHLRVTRPDDCPWYRGPLLSTRPWRRIARARGRILLVTGPFTHPAEFWTAAHGGHLLCAAADVVLSDCF
jgi:hypothetical protein